ncbi:protoporphyrinogen oxidase like protein [Zymoseptoria brevis]|uniref:Protoporphyrinogen oxidase n=1 Tax=Zymoseptoria brevis TaxID=1047168 RepID=A0A0F4GYT3_9PEZI|nr:protoporphyrinogen oxidase like protein [Zymoseptoria brevis]
MLHSRSCTHRLLAPAVARRITPLVTSQCLLQTHGSRTYSAEAAPSHDVAVLGGGITGLAAAHYLTREHPRAKVTLYEASDRVGGWVSSKRADVHDGTVLFEGGPRTLRPNGNGVLAASLMQELDLTKDAIFTQKSSPAAQNRFVYYPDHIVRMPHPSAGLFNNLWSLMTEPVFATALKSGFMEAFKNGRDGSIQDESIADFFSRRLSPTMVDRILSAVIHGIYAGDVNKLSAKSLFPNQWRHEAKYDSLIKGVIQERAEGTMVTKREADFLQAMKVFEWDPLLKATLKDNSVFTFTDGLQMLPDRLHLKLFEDGRVEFKTGSPVESIVQSQGNSGIQVTTKGSTESKTHTHVISALSPEHLNKVCRHGSASSRLIESIPTVTVMTVSMYFRTPDLHEPGFGYLIPQATPFENNPERALGVVFDTAYSPGSSDVDPARWHVDADQLRQAREQGRLINVNDFAWYNMPDVPNMQDHVKSRGTKVTVMLGGHWWDGWPAFPDEEEGVTMARAVLERHLGIKEAPEAWQVNLQADCIPQYTVGHETRLKKAHNNIWQEYKGRLRVAGNWMSGVGVNDCLRSAYEVARNLSKDGTGLEHVGEAPTLRMKPVRPGEKTEES